jgi:hypothetical protein
MVHYLAVLPSGLPVTQLTENWRGQVRSFLECRLEHWIGAPHQLRDRPQHQLDWGTCACELEDGDISIVASQSVVERLPALAEGERRVALWVECS